ncbi:MAG TPA: hypothetical protein VFE23_18915 [Usitatibacter sp.]|jgi:hypothetical protein|nr:hypothetical protein [Usitatibacter sp.]
MTRHFLYLTNTRVVSLETSRAQIVARREFAVSVAGAAEFERYVGHMEPKPVHILTDIAEEDIRLDSIPHVGSRDRGAILARKLAQIFRNTQYRYAQVQGRETDGRRDDRVMYTAITNPEVLRPWLEVLERLRVPVAGIHSVAVFSRVLLEELDLAFPHALLVTLSPGGFMRQSYFRDGELRFSRLTPIDLGEGQTLGTMIAEETTRTWQYLDSLRHFGPEDRLEVCVLLHPNDRLGVQTALRDFAQIQYRILDIESVAAKLGLRQAPLGSTAEEILVHLYLIRRAPNHFASDEQRRHDTVRRARIAINRAAAAAIALGVAWCAWNVGRVLVSGEADQRLTQQLTGLNREYDEITRSMPSFGVAGATMREAVRFYDGSIRRFPTVNGFAVPLSQVLARHPEVQLTQFAWMASDDPKAMPPLRRMASPVVPPVQAVTRDADAIAAQAAAVPANAPFSSGRYEVAMIEGTVHVANNDFRGALEDVQRLATELAQGDGNTSAEVVESPLDVRPTLELRGRHAQKEPASMDPHFVLRVVHIRPGAA